MSEPPVTSPVESNDALLPPSDEPEAKLTTDGIEIDSKLVSDERDEDKELPANTPAQMLLQALQNFIVPLINVERQTDEKNPSPPRSLGPEATKFLAALQEFISWTVLRSQTDNQNGIEVGLDDDSESTTDQLGIPSIERDVPLPKNPEEKEPERSQDQTSLPKHLTALREHVFNTMPIRMLCITPTPTSDRRLRITLLERGGIYTHLAAKLESNYSKSDFRSGVTEELKVLGWGYKRTDAERIVIKRMVAQYAKYAVLSHTWSRAPGGEVTYDDWQRGALDTRQSGYLKLVKFCKSVWTDYRLTLGWMDTVCINKESSTELDESIRSMYKWYRDADICITYLAGTGIVSDMHRDPWFTRGWTLQELLAPAKVKFYNRDWKKLIDSGDPLFISPFDSLIVYSSDSLETDKHHFKILEQIHRATGITKKELNDLHSMPISRRMQLAAKREVMREEDTAYSLMGICDVSISIAYGEGADRAFFRLVTEIMNSSECVLDIFNCGSNAYTSEYRISSLIPCKPLHYLQRSSNEDLILRKPIEPLLLTHLGLRVPVLLMPALPAHNPALQNVPLGDFHATISDLIVTHQLPTSTVDSVSATYNLLDKGIASKPDNWTWPLQGKALNDRDLMTFGTLNFGGDQANIHVPKTCLAVFLWSSDNVGWESTSPNFERLRTKAPIVFSLKRKNASRNSDDHDKHYYSIKKNMLAKHGMQIVSLYL